jgi:hypothetical protein
MATDVTVFRMLAMTTHNLHGYKYETEKLLFKWCEYDSAYLDIDFRSVISSLIIRSTEKYIPESNIVKTAKLHIELIFLRNYVGAFDRLLQWSMCQLLRDTTLRFIEIYLYWKRSREFCIAFLTNLIIRVL